MSHSRSHSRIRRWPVVVVLAAALLSGCDDGSSSTADPSDPTRTPPTSTPTAAESVSTSPTVAPNDGPLLANPTIELRAPAGWTKQQAIARTEASATYYGEDDRNGLISLGWQLDWDSDATLDQLAKNVRHTFGSTFDIERGPDVEIAGEPAYHFTGTASGGLQLFDSFGTHRDGRFVFIDFYADKATTRAERQEVIDGTLASARWKR